MNNNFTFHKTLVGSLQSKVDVSIWDQVTALWEKKDYKNSLLKLFDYVDINLVKKYANSDQSEFSFPHGSVIVNVKISATDFIAEAPFLNISTAKKIPLLRQVAQLNFYPLSLAQIDQEGDNLYFRFSCPIDLCEPYKIYDVLREICINADQYDDEFMQKFDAKRIQEPKITSYSDADKQTAWDRLQTYIAEAEIAFKYMQEKRLTGFEWDTVMITLMKFEYMTAPQGKLRNELEKTIVFLNGSDDIAIRLQRGKEFIQTLKNMTRATFDADLYTIETLIPYKYRSVLQTVRDNFKGGYEQAKKEMDNNDHLAACLTLQYNFFLLFYNNNVDDQLAGIITPALEAASGKPIQEASKILYAAMEEVMTGQKPVSNAIPPGRPVQQESVETKEEKKGFFSKIFGA